MTHEIHDHPELRDADEQALAGLLTRAHRPPRLRPAARAAILVRLKAEQRRIAHEPNAGGRAARNTEGVGAVSRIRRQRFGGVAALVAAAALFVLWLRLPQQPVMHHNDSIVPRVVSFGDGSRMVLDAGARMIERHGRELELLHGRALVDVTSGSRYVVASAHGRLIVEGARFVVSADGAEMSAAVARGQVEAVSDGGETLLAAGDRGVLSTGRAPVRTAARRLSYLAAWAREALAADESPEVQPIRRGNLEARIPDSTTAWPLPMRKLAVDVYIEDGVVRTTFDHTFFNHHNRNLEGVYRFSLPSDAAVSRLAMYVDGTLMEGGIVERDRGRDIYEDIVYRRRDPALLEWMSGNELKVRIFPLPARTEKRILMSYTQVLERLYDTQRLVVPIPEIDEPVGEVTYRIRVADGARYHIASTSHPLAVRSEGAGRVAVFAAEQHAIGRDLVVSLTEEEPTPKSARTFTGGNHRYLLARVQPDLPHDRAAREPRDWVVLFDTSASRSAGAMKAQERMLVELASELDPRDRVAVVAFDVTQRIMREGFTRVGDLDPRDLEGFLEGEARDRIGYTDLGGALTTARALLDGREHGGPGHILYLGDGVPTAGKREPAELRALVAGHRFVGVGIGDRADGGALRDLAEASEGAFVKVTPDEDLSWRAFDLVAELNTPRLTGIKAQVLDANGDVVAGEVHVSAQATGGEDITVIARLPKGSDAAAVALRAGPWSERVSLAEARAGAKFLPRLWARKHIDALVREDRHTHEAAITELGLSHFLVTPFTSLLVLETEADYRKHSVVRPAADRWARYAAPAAIDVVREPLDEPAIPFGAVVLRQRRRTSTRWTWGDQTALSGLKTEIFALPRVRMGGAGDSMFAPGIVDLPMDGKLARLSGRLEPREAPRGPRWAREAKRPVTTKPDRTRGEAQRQLATGAYVAGKGGYLDPTLEVDTVLVDEDFREDLSGWGQFSRASLGDVSALVPALFADGIDAEREQARRARAEGKQGEISKEARALLDGVTRERARYRFPDGREVSVGDTRIVTRGASAMGLREELAFDGETLVADYPELRLRVERDGTGAAMATLAKLAPFVTPTTSELEGHYDVRVVGRRVVRIAPLGEGAAVELTLDEAGRVTRYVRAGTVITVKWTADAVTVQPEHAEPVTIARAAETPIAALPSRDVTWTTIRLPLREMDLTRRRVEQAERGSGAWRAALRQLMATEAAFGQPSWTHIDALVAAGATPTRGELVLASRGVPGQAKDTLEDLADPVARYLLDVLRHRNGAGAKAFAPRDGDGPLMASLRAYQRVVTTHVSDFDTWRPLLAPLEDAHPRLRLAALSHVANRTLDSGTDDVVAAFDALAAQATADSAVRREAQLRAAERLRWRGRPEEASKRFAAVIDAEDARGVHLDASRLRQTFLSTEGGTEAFRRWMLARRDRLVAIGTPAALVAAAVMLDSWGTPDDLEVVMNVVRRTEIRDASAAHALAFILNRRGFIADADRLTRAHVASGPMAHAMLLLAADIATNDNRHDEAAELVKRAMDRREEMTLSELRQLYRRRFELHVAHARATSSPHIEDALAVAAQWRREDPDNAEIDELCFDALTARGDHVAAFRHLSSIIERHPGEGASYTNVAKALIRHGRLVEAELHLRRASEVEPTNPRWLLELATVLEALQRPDEARAVLERVAEGSWQDRFSREVAEAKRRLGG